MAYFLTASLSHLSQYTSQNMMTPYNEFPVEDPV